MMKEYDDDYFNMTGSMVDGVEKSNKAISSIADPNTEKEMMGYETPTTLKAGGGGGAKKEKENS
jgi:hypothetical protein